MHTKKRIKQNVMKPYSFMLFVLNIVSAVVTMVSAFIPAFAYRLLGQTVKSENGIDYVKALYPVLINDISEELQLDGKIYFFIMAILVVCLLILPIKEVAESYFWGYRALANGKFYQEDDVKKNSAVFSSSIWVGIILCGIYYLFCMYNILTYFSWDFEMVFSDRALIVTKTYWPVIIQIVLLFFVFLVKQMMIIAYRSANAYLETREEPKNEDVSIIDKTLPTVDTVVDEENNIPAETRTGDYQIILLKWDNKSFFSANASRLVYEMKKIAGWEMSDVSSAIKSVPIPVVTCATYEEAEQIKQRLEKVGCEIEIKQQE